MVFSDSNRKIVILSVPDTKEDILEKILKAVEGFAEIEERTLPSEIIEYADLKILLPEKKVYRNGKEILLNCHEFDTLVYLARHPGWVRSKEQIYEVVWTAEVADYENAVMWCISRLRKKLEPDSDRLQYIHTVKGVGYKFEYHPIRE
ncbi:MAG: winged helix-turn-helix transcriptional regulator [Eubacterium sp.]|nr:winged helix-turn-helix transcriptional regulator [Eubacterium sp.]